MILDSKAANMLQRPAKTKIEREAVNEFIANARSTTDVLYNIDEVGWQ